MGTYRIILYNVRYRIFYKDEIMVVQLYPPLHIF